MAFQITDEERTQIIKRLNNRDSQLGPQEVITLVKRLHGLEPHETYESDSAQKALTDSIWQHIAHQGGRPHVSREGEPRHI